MSDQVTQVSDFGRDQLTILALTGTVALPSPFPASGKLYLGLFSFQLDDQPTFYLKLVESISDKKAITRYVKPEDVQAIRVYSPPTESSTQGCWLLRIAEEITLLLENPKAALTAARKGNSVNSFETVLFPEAILYVPEAAPVLVRLETGMTAAECCYLESKYHVESGCCRH